MALWVVFCVLVAARAAKAHILVDPATHGFVDEYGRQRIFRGVNGVYKVAPWHPVLIGFDANNTLSSEDAKLLNNWGFNAVRLGVMWPGLEPDQGKYDSKYLDAIETIVDNLSRQGIFTLLDFHQDLWARPFCGEGVPDYVFSKCQKEAEGKRTKPFPAPVAKSGSYPTDSSGNPQLSSCLSKAFFTYYLTEEVSSAFQCLYENTDGLWDDLGRFWQQVAARFKDDPNVLGYELINEPWLGDIYNHPALMEPGKTEKTLLQPMYQHLHNMIREIDSAKMLFFEGLTIDYWPVGFTSAPGPSPEYDNRQVLSYHIYCLPDPSGKIETALCSGANSEFFSMREKDAQRLKVGMMMTEFGATMAKENPLHDLDALTRVADKHGQSWMYWQYKYFQDITTSTPVGESLFNNDGSPSVEKLNILTRPFPSAIAGHLGSFGFEAAANGVSVFTLEYSLLTAVAPGAGDSASISSTTIINLNGPMHFPKGLLASVSGPGAAKLTVSCVDASHIQLVQSSNASTPEEATVTVTLSSDCQGKSCTCAF